MTRREFLKAMGAVGGVAALGTIAGCRSEYREAFPLLPENHVSLSKNGKSVVILGAGVAGLQAGCELVDRGFDVTILERNALPGGKLKSWRDRDFGLQKMPPSFPGWPVEHGIHGVWGFYKNFREFLFRHRIPLTEKKLGTYSYAFSDGKVEDLSSPTFPPPSTLRRCSLPQRGSLGKRSSTACAAFANFPLLTPIIGKMLPMPILSPF